MTRTNYDSLNMLKARIGEFYVEDLLLRLKYKVFRFGWETTLQNLMNLDVNIKPSETKSRVSAMPDFLVISPDGNIILIEVKLWTIIIHDELKKKVEKIN